MTWLDIDGMDLEDVAMLRIIQSKDCLGYEAV